MPNDITEHSPLISVGVASYNNSKYILDTLKSIVSQSYKNIELIIVDDCSKDDSVERINEFIKTVSIPVKFHINQQNQGVVNVCNKLLNLLNGTYYTLIGSDDVMLPDRIEKQLQVMLSEDADMVFGRIIAINETGDIIEHFKNNEIIADRTTDIHLTFKELIEKNIISAPSVMLKTEAVKSINGYNTKYTIEDLPLWISLAKNKKKIVYTNKILVHYRILSFSLNTKIATPLSHFLLVKDNIKEFSLINKLTVYIFWAFKFANDKEFKNAYKYCKRSDSAFIYWCSLLTNNKLFQFCFYKFLKFLAQKPSIKFRYDGILAKLI